MIETTVLALFAMAMLSLAGGLWQLQKLIPPPPGDGSTNSPGPRSSDNRVPGYPVSNH
jgi:hypothetical protein